MTPHKRDNVSRRARNAVTGRPPGAPLPAEPSLRSGLVTKLIRLSITPLFIFTFSCSPSREAPSRTSPALLRTPTIESSEPWFFESAEGRLIRTRSYRLFTTETDPDLRRAMPDFLERALDHYTTSLAPLPRPDLKLDTFLMTTRAQWESLTRQVMGASAAPYLRIQRGGFASSGRALLFTIGHRDTLAIAAHEGWHQYTQRTFRQELPVWLEEGIAAYMEGFIADPAEPELPLFRPWANPERFEQLIAAHKAGRLIPLSRLLEVSPANLLSADTDLALTYYAQVWALVHFLRDHPSEPEAQARESQTSHTRASNAAPHTAPLSRLLQDAATGKLRSAIDRRHGPGASQRLARERRGPEVFTTYFNIPNADQAYDNFLHSVVNGSKDNIVAGLSPHETTAR